MDGNEEEMQLKETNVSEVLNFENQGAYSDVLFSNTDETSLTGM